MELQHQGFTSELPAIASALEQRLAPRAKVLIRPAKLICAAGEFVTVVRDISVHGVRLKTFHLLPDMAGALLAFPTGETIAVELVWQRDDQIGLRFTSECDVDRVIAGDGAVSPRPLRISLGLPGRLELTALQGRAPSAPPLSVAIGIENLSGQGARITSPVTLAQDQPVRIGTSGMALVAAHVRWRREHHYGLAFEDTFTLSEFARIAARLQAPDLLTGRFLGAG